MRDETWPYLLYLPFGWTVASFAEAAKAGATMTNGMQALTQLGITLAFLALERK